MHTRFLFFAGERLSYIGQPDWGIGQVLEDAAEPIVEVFFEYLGRTTIDTGQDSVARVETGSERHPILDLLAVEDLNWKRARHNIYIVLLDKAAFDHWRFREANRHYSGGKPCIYVGMTGLTPEARLRNHKKGHKSNYYVKRHGVRLLSGLYESFNPMPYKLAQVVEAEIAERLRSQGYAVWQH